MAEVSVGKRIKINKMQQQMMLAVIGTSLAFGVCLVLSVYFIKLINFNSKVITAKNESIKNYYTAIKNVGICVDDNNDGKYTDVELAKCDPNAIDVTTISNTLRYNTMVTMANNTDLESVARDAQKDCYDSNGKKNDYTEVYRNATTTEERDNALYMMRKCSALRVIPDALPSSQNKEALLASLNQLFYTAGWEPESLSPGSGSTASPVSGLLAMPVSLSVKTDTATTLKVLQSIEKSIRPFIISSARISWSGDNALGSQNLELTASAVAFYTSPVSVSETTKTVYASKGAKTAASTSTTTKAN